MLFWDEDFNKVSDFIHLQLANCNKDYVSGEYSINIDSHRIFFINLKYLWRM